MLQLREGAAFYIGPNEEHYVVNIGRADLRVLVTTPLPQRELIIDGETTPFGAQFAFPGLATFPMLPATSVPIGHDPDGMPIGVQVIANSSADHDAIAIARVAHDLMRNAA